MNELVLLPLASTLTGYSEKAMRRKIEDGVWLEGYEYVRAPDNRILVDMTAFDRWARGEPRELKRAVRSNPGAAN